MVVIGLDALDPILLSMWIDELPTFRSMIAEGTFGQMRSTIPPLTIPAWVTMLTGKPPEELGTFGLVDLQKDYSIRPFDPARWKGEYLWDIIGHSGRKVGVLGVPFLVSPYPVSGFLVTDPAWGEVRTFPDDFRTKMQVEKATGPTWRQLAVMWRNIEKEKRFILDVLEGNAPDFFFFYLPATDSTMHWGSRRELKDAYRKIDAFLSEIIPACKGQRVFIVSDHGCKEGTCAFNVPTFLARQGLLRPGESRLRGLRAVLVQTVIKLLYRIPNLRLLLTNISVTLAWRHQLMRPHLLERINLRKSQFIPAGAGGSWFAIWVNRVDNFDLGVVRADSEGKVLNHLIGIFSNLHDLNGRSVVKSILTREDLGYDHSLLFPDLVVQLEDPFVPSFEDLWSSTWLHYNELVHSDQGVFLAIGPDIRRHHKVDGIEITDLAPTVLHTLGNAIPQRLPGRVLREIFESTSELAKRDVKHEHLEEPSGAGRSLLTKDEEERIVKRLSALGYLG